MRLELSDGFWSNPLVEEAQSHSRKAPALFVRGLSYMAERGWDPSPGSDRCLSSPVVWGLLIDESTKQYRRPSTALVRAGLWEPVINHKGKPADAWWVCGKGDLWRIRPMREPIPVGVRSAVLERDGDICQICLCPIEDDQNVHLDHIVPVSAFGRSTVDNLRVAHSTCNLRKGARLEEARG